jgi:hypothetical protein
VNDTTHKRSRLSNRRTYRRIWLGPLPIVFAALGAIVLLGAWRLAADPDRHEQQKYDPQPRHFVDVEGAIAPLYVVGDASADALLILGDSRARTDISLTILARRGVDPVGLLWNGFAQLNYQLRAARSMPPRRLLVCLTPSGLYVAPMKRMAMLLEKERAVPLTQRIDERLSTALDVFRQRRVRTLEPLNWTIDYVEPKPEPERLAGLYRKLMDEKFHAPRQEQFEELRRNLREMRDSGFRILCVRLPASTMVEEAEDKGFPPEQFRDMCADLGFPYLDLSGRDPPTADGTHLLGEDAEAMSVELADWLRAQPELQVR